LEKKAVVAGVGRDDHTNTFEPTPAGNNSINRPVYKFFLKTVQKW